MARETWQLPCHGRPRRTAGFHETDLSQRCAAARRSCARARAEPARAAAGDRRDVTTARAASMRSARATAMRPLDRSLLTLLLALHRREALGGLPRRGHVAPVLVLLRSAVLRSDL